MQTSGEGIFIGGFFMYQREAFNNHEIFLKGTQT